VRPIDSEQRDFRIAALKYALGMGADAIIPPGDFPNLSSAVDIIGDALKGPLNDDERVLLQKEYPAVRDYPFFES
jgi:hypothetical protein